MGQLPNVHDITEIGAHPRRWDELTGDWEHRSTPYALPQPGPPGGPFYWGSDFVVLVFASHNGLQMDPRQYTGLDYVTPLGKTAFK